MDYTAHGILQARILEWVAFSFSLNCSSHVFFNVTLVLKGKLNFNVTFIYVLNSIYLIRASLVAQTVKNLPAMWETWVQSLGWEDPLEEGMAIHP